MEEGADAPLLRFLLAGLSAAVAGGFFVHGKDPFGENGFG